MQTSIPPSVTPFALPAVSPSVELSLGRMVNPKDLEEGDDVYFSCSIKANPPAYKLTWWHNVSISAINR